LHDYFHYLQKKTFRDLNNSPAKHDTFVNL